MPKGGLAYGKASKGVKMYGIDNSSGSKPIGNKGQGNMNKRFDQAPRSFKGGGAGKMKSGNSKMDY